MESWGFWAVALRTAGVPTVEALRHELPIDRTPIRTWAQRDTLHATPEMIAEMATRVGDEQVPRYAAGWLFWPRTSRRDLQQALGRLAQSRLLILDDLGLAVPKAAQRHDLLEVLEDRDGRAYTIVTSQLPVSKWYEWLDDDPTLADAILDRLVHAAYKFGLKGESGRKNRARKD